MTTEPTHTPHPNQAIIEETLKLMNLSSMNEQERTMWTILLPSMEKTELEKFRDTLALEVQEMTDLYLRAKEAAEKAPKA